MFQLIYSTLIMFAIVITAMRLMGKRQIGELELNELVVVIIISEMAAMPIVDLNMSLWHGIVPIVTLLLCEIAIAYFSMKSIKFRQIVNGKPSIIIDNGKIVQHEMRKNRLTIDELMEELRSQSIADASTVKYAILETGGTLSTILYKAHSPVTNAAMSIQQEDTGLPTLVINGGRVLTHNLKLLGLNEGWLQNELARRGAKSPEDVFIMSIDERKNIYFCMKE